MAAQMTAKELAKMVQLCGRAEDQGIIDDEDVKQLIKAMDDAALPTLGRGRRTIGCQSQRDQPPSWS